MATTIDDATAAVVDVKEETLMADDDTATALTPVKNVVKNEDIHTETKDKNAKDENEPAATAAVAAAAANNKEGAA